ncbi:MAG: N-formylglutamate amidohydrolase [Pseudomonadota bacterium]
MTETASDGRVVEIANPRGRARAVLVCEHASPYIPPEYKSLGISETGRYAHAVWDPGAEWLARAVSDRLDAPLALSRVSRLVHDCNRPAGSTAACPEKVERIVVPGNRGLTEIDRQARANAVYHPFHQAVAGVLAEKGRSAALVTVHSFSPTWHGKARSCEIGLLHDADDSLARAMMAAASLSDRVELNQPYSAADGVTHTLARYSDRVQASVMIEVRNDLLTDQQGVDGVAETITGLLLAAVNQEATLQ